MPGRCRAGRRLCRAEVVPSGCRTGRRMCRVDTMPEGRGKPRRAAGHGVLPHFLIYWYYHAACRGRKGMKGAAKTGAGRQFAGGLLLLVLAALAGGAWSLPGWRCWRPAACLAHGRARLFGSLALVLVLFIGWLLWPAPGRYTPPPVSYPSRRTRPTPPRLAPAPARACPSCRRAPVPPSPDGPPKIATARRRGYLPRPVSSPGKLC